MRVKGEPIKCGWCGCENKAEQTTKLYRMCRCKGCGRTLVKYRRPKVR